MSAGQGVQWEAAVLVSTVLGPGKQCADHGHGLKV